MPFGSIINVSMVRMNREEKKYDPSEKLQSMAAMFSIISFFEEMTKLEKQKELTNGEILEEEEK